MTDPEAGVEIFGRPRVNDLSQLTPRGHHAVPAGSCDSRLENYFQAMMWLSRFKFNCGPTRYELYYAGSTQILSRDLSPETIWSGEVEYSHRLSTTMTALVAGYTNYVEDLISLNNVQQADGSVVQQYQNSSNPVQTWGAEAEMRREWRSGWMLSATYSLQHSRFLGDTALLRKVPNSPEHMAALKGAVPLIGRALSLMTRITVEGPRYDTHYVVDPTAPDTQTQTDPFFVWDLVFSGEAETLGVRWNVGAYNLTDMKYTAIPSVEFAQRQILQNGRTLLANVNVTF
jgi:outer membrane receptor protein involved in Fe transport